MVGAKFEPRVAVSPQEMRSLFFDTSIMKRLGATATADSRPANPAANVIDGDPNTFWLSGGKGAPHPHAITVHFSAPAAISGLVLMPRQNHREHEGDIREYAIQVSDDGTQWREVKRGELISSFAPQQVRLPETVTARHLRLTALSGYGTDPASALAEFALIHAGPSVSKH